MFLSGPWSKGIPHPHAYRNFSLKLREVSKLGKFKHGFTCKVVFWETDCGRNLMPGGAYMWKHVGCAHLFAILLCGGTGLESVTLDSTGPVQEIDALVVSASVKQSSFDKDKALFSQTCHLSQAFPRLHWYRRIFVNGSHMHISWRLASWGPFFAFSSLSLQPSVRRAAWVESVSIWWKTIRPNHSNDVE